MSDALRKENVPVAVIYVPGILAVVIACMSLIRDILRDAHLKPYFHPAQFAVRTQWSVLPLFRGALPWRGDPLVRGAEALWTAWQKVAKRTGFVKRSPDWCQRRRAQPVRFA
jgi:hypothetical protein